MSSSKGAASSGKKKHSLGQRSLLSFFGGQASGSANPSPLTGQKTGRKHLAAIPVDDYSDGDDLDALVMAVHKAEQSHQRTVEPTPPPKRTKLNSDQPEVDISQFANTTGRSSSPITPEESRAKAVSASLERTPAVHHTTDNDEDDNDDDEVVIRRKAPTQQTPLALTPSTVHRPFGTLAPVEERRGVREKLLQSFDMADGDSPVSEPKGEAKWSQSNEWATNVRDSQKRRPGEKGYDPTTLYIPPKAMDRLTPFQRQFWEIKSQNYDTILLFKKGKFYECYDKDADIGARELNLNYTGGGRVDMRCVGVPESAFSRHAARLVDLGYRVGRVDQVETALAMENRTKQGNKAGPSICKRALVKILTGATLIDEDLLPDFQSRYLLAVKEVPVVSDISSDQADVVVGICLVDAAVGAVVVGQFEDDLQRTKLETLLARTRPKEVLLECDFDGELLLAERSLDLLKSCCAQKAEIMPQRQGSFFPSCFDPLAYFDSEKIPTALTEFCASIPPDTENAALSSLGAVAVYLKKLKVDEQIIPLGNFSIYQHGDNMSSAIPESAFTLIDQSQSNCLVLDGTTLDNLEILGNSSDGGENGSLVSFIDRCSSPMGRRLLRRWVCKPLLDPDLINDRLNAIELLHGLDGASFDDLRQRIRKIPDMERALTRLHSEATVSVDAIHFDDTNKRQVKSFVKILRGLEKSLALLTWLNEELRNDGSKLVSKRLAWLTGPGNAIPNSAAKSLDFFLQSAFEVETAEESGNLVPLSGCDEVLDKAGSAKEAIEKQMADLLAAAKRVVGDKSLKFRHQGKEPYQIEVPIAKKSRVPISWALKSQSKTLVRYWSPEIADLIKDFKEADEALDAAQTSFMKRILEKFDRSYGTWSSVARAVSEIDVLTSLAMVSFMDIDSMCRPTFVSGEEPIFDATELRHPCLALRMGPNFVPNDIYLGPATEEREKGGSTIVVTGPNMGGKSTILRQTCIAVIMAQLGCYVPASSCRLSPVDRIYTRIGAQDRISRGQSTFLVEMDETAGILRGATKNSLVVLDELGRGTSTFDGFSIAWAVLRELNERIQCRCLFSTHYHMLTEYASSQSEDNSRIALYCMTAVVDVERKEITFLYKFEPGVAEKSRGIYCARLAGIGDKITDRATHLAEAMRISLEARLQSNQSANALRQLDAALRSSDPNRLRQLQKRLSQLTS